MRFFLGAPVRCGARMKVEMKAASLKRSALAGALTCDGTFKVP
jgi:hypothetical protein